MPAGPRQIFLAPGGHIVADAGCRIRTLLGSCVAMTLWHPGRRVGAMSHFLLATRGTAPAHAHALALDGRYGDEALELMALGLGARNVRMDECDAKVFGGGDMFPLQRSGKALNVGHANGHAALALLRARGIPVRSESLFGLGHRQVIFDVATGQVWMRQVAPAEREQE